ncbi:hypothetical protein HYW46_02265 [Candidatus Daviesbacteria bacterium]|nr:hypothetical protein [Candidatus Daviesbacteria bacterium]
MDINQIIDIYRKVIEPKIKNWVVFSSGTCVILYHPKGDLETEAKEVLQKYGTSTPGTPSADFQVMKLEGLPGWIVSGDQPGILNYVSEDEGKEKEDWEIGLIARDKKEQDLKELKIIHVQS